ncbi:MAG: sialidase family protein [Candidatus Latescibacterota bacterium]
MKQLNFPEDLKTRRGDWTTTPDINVTDLCKRDIYRAAEEPSYVSWAILWKERSGQVKLSFVEMTGDKTAWPPTYNPNSRDMEYYLKTLVSSDGGKTWRDTGWREALDSRWERNADHHIRYVIELADGTLMRNYGRTIEGVTSPCRMTEYDADMENAGSFFPFSSGDPVDSYPKFSSIWTSDNGGKSWKEIYLFDQQPPLFITAIHPLTDGTIVALGAFRPDETDQSTWSGALTESRDGGKTWSDAVVITVNDDRINPQGLDEEADFVELEDGRLLVIWRSNAPGSCMRQLTLKRDRAGIWQATPARINRSFPHSGYPYMCRASDGTIFYYCLTSIKYSCDDGETWAELPLGSSYYGELVEVSPGRMLAVTQKNIGDCPYPWKEDTSMLQTTFGFQRIGVARQEDSDATGALSDLDVGTPTDFHLAMEVKVDAAGGLAYQVTEAGYRFVALTMPANASRLPAPSACEPDAFLSRPPRASEPQNVFMQIGEVVGDRTHILRKIWVGKMVPGAWAQLQVSRAGELLKAAVNLTAAPGTAVVYTCFKDEGAGAGALALFTNKSTGAFKNVRFSDTPETIRTNWFGDQADEQGRIALDAGRGE